MSVVVVNEQASLAQLCGRVRGAERVGLDTEFHAERSYAPRLMVVQLAFDDGAAIVDPLALPDLSSLAQALQGPTVVGHALSSDLRIFADRFDNVPEHIFDTQVAAAFLNYGLQVSLVDLVHDLQGVRLAKSQTVSDWSARPFSARQLDYLVDDVAHLLPMSGILRERLEAVGRYEWALQECAQLSNVANYRLDDRRACLRIPGAMRMSRRELGVLSELVKLRDRIARERDVPLKYVLPDDVVGGLASLQPAHLDDLVQLRRLDAGARRQLGAEILQAVVRGQSIPEENLPERPKRPLGQARDSLASLLAVVVAEVASEAGLPANLLVARSALERVAREAPQDRAAFEAALGLQSWRLDLVGEPLWRLLSGQRSVGIEGYATGNPKVRLSNASTPQ